MVVPCIYCGKPVRKVKKGEHLFPEAMGGVKAIKKVCGSCNNSDLSQLDDQLVSRSQLGMLACEILGKQFFYSWDVDHSANDLLMESEPIFKDGSFHNMRLWPQLILEGEHLQFRADLDEVNSYGREHAYRHVFAQAKRCFREWDSNPSKKRKNGLMFQRIPPGVANWQSYRMPPRIFAKRRLAEFTRDMSMIVRYVSSEDKQRLLNRLSKITPELNVKDEREFRLTERRPQFSQEWQPKVIVRALTKMGINLLSHLCTKTRVDVTTFSEAIAFVLGKKDLPFKICMQWGFVWPNDVAEIHRLDNGHAARLAYDARKGMWKVYFSFFGGRMAAIVEIPGPNDEDWVTANVSTPLSSKDRDVNDEWEETRSNLYLPMRVHVDWEDATRTNPGIAYLKRSPNIYYRLPVRIEERRTHTVKTS